MRLRPGRRKRKMRALESRESRRFEIEWREVASALLGAVAAACKGEPVPNSLFPPGTYRIRYRYKDSVSEYVRVV